MDVCSATGGAHCRHYPAEDCCFCNPAKAGEKVNDLLDQLAEKLNVEHPAVIQTKATLRRDGCTCAEPSIEVMPIGSALGIQFAEVIVRHDDECPLLRRQQMAANAKNN